MTDFVTQEGIPYLIQEGKPLKDVLVQDVPVQCSPVKPDRIRPKNTKLDQINLETEYYFKLLFSKISNNEINNMDDLNDFLIDLGFTIPTSDSHDEEWFNYYYPKLNDIRIVCLNLLRTKKEWGENVDVYFYYEDMKSCKIKTNLHRYPDRLSKIVSFLNDYDVPFFTKEENALEVVIKPISWFTKVKNALEIVIKTDSWFRNTEPKAPGKMI